MIKNNSCVGRNNLHTFVLLIGMVLIYPASALQLYGYSFNHITQQIVKDSVEALALCEQAEDFFNGSNGLSMNREKAKELYIKAAGMNCALAQYEIYNKWKDTDCQIAKKYLQMAAEQRYIPAIIAIAEEYLDPAMMCMEENIELAVYWAKIGAEMGVDELQFMLGIYYNSSDGNDIEQAKYWFGLQAEKGDEVSQRFYGQILQKEGFMKGNAHMEAEGLAWLEKAALQGDGESMFYLGVTYKYIKKNIQEAARWLKSGTDAGNEDCMLEYAGLLRDGEGVKQDKKAAFSYFLQVAEKGRPEGQRFVALAYWLGEGVKKNKDEALVWFERAAAQGDKQSIEFLSNYVKHK